MVSIHLCPKWALEYHDFYFALACLPSFNPSMPKVGVGILLTLNMPKIKNLFQSIYAQSGRWNIICCNWTVASDEFQSIYAQSGRWNAKRKELTKIHRDVSIHLCPKWALEFQTLISPPTKQYSFNPSMPKVGVGISTNQNRFNHHLFVSIHLCPKWALESKLS